MHVHLSMLNNYFLWEAEICISFNLGVTSIFVYLYTFCISFGGGGRVQSLEQGMGSEFVLILNNKHQYFILVIIKNIEIQSAMGIRRLRPLMFIADCLFSLFLLIIHPLYIKHYSSCNRYWLPILMSIYLTNNPATTAQKGTFPF